MEAEEQEQVPQSGNVVIGLGSLWILLALAILAIQFVVPPKIDIVWETETEIDTAGFNIYRSETADGEFSRLNEQMIPSQSDAVSGATYLYTDKNVERGKTYYYRLEDIEFDNSTQQHDLLIGEVNALDWWTIPLFLASGSIGIAMTVYGIRQNRKISSEGQPHPNESFH